MEKLKALVELRKRCGVPFVINARTDAFRFCPGDTEAKLAEAVRRSNVYKALGVDCVYPMGLVESAHIGKFVEEVQFPMNVMVRKGLPPVAELQKLGVARMSFGPAASYATFGFLKRAAKEVMEKGTFESLVEGAINFDELNALAVPRK
ncbi:MAG: isocitrate lyase/phosphoenolpyruvate mutase family protein [archaeon]|nr:MAG: isocitrate lyase/phosphoenolpyruvate mutase family protein [archaeon]